MIAIISSRVAQYIIHINLQYFFKKHALASHSTELNSDADNAITDPHVLIDTPTTHAVTATIQKLKNTHPDGIQP